MKNVLKNSLYLVAFAVAGILFQISCSNSDTQTNFTATPPPVGKLIYYKRLVNGTNSGAIYTCNYDGTNESMVNLALPANVYLSGNLEDLNIRISPDGDKIFFVVFNSTTNYKSIYSSDITGNNVTEVMNLNDEGTISLGAAY